MNKNVLKSGIELIIIMVSAIIAAYAWFFNGTEAKPTDLTMSTHSFIDLLISADGGETWTNETTLNLPKDFIFGNEVTSDGTSFYVKNLEKDDGTPINFQPAVVNKDYLEFQIQFKSTSKCGIFLEENSFIHPLAGTTTNELLGNDAISKSSSGNFSRDLIAGAVRMSVTPDSKVGNKYYPTSTPTMVWAPNPNYKVSCENNYCNASISSTDDQNYEYVDVLSANYYDLKMPKNIHDQVRASYESNKTNGDSMLLYIDDVDEVYSATFRIWIEGNDREAITALTGGEFVINLSFIAFNKQLNSEIPSVSISGNRLNGFDEETMELSNDYGMNWNTTFDNIDYDKPIYVRYKETNNTFASEYRELNS